MLRLGLANSAKSTQGVLRCSAGRCGGQGEVVVQRMGGGDPTMQGGCVECLDVEVFRIQHEKDYAQNVKHMHPSNLNVSSWQC